MRKYKIENFRVELIEEVTAETVEELKEKLNECEMYWIAEYDSFNKGYNMTLGGEGTRMADYDLIYKLWLNDKTRSARDISKITNYNRCTISRALRAYGITDEEIKEHGYSTISKPIKARNINTNEITRYPSAHEVARQMGINPALITQCCKGRYKALSNSNGEAYQFAYEDEEFLSFESFNSSRARSVISTDLVTGEEIEYPSAAEATRQTGVNTSNIVQCCKGKRKTAGGKAWQYKYPIIDKEK